jgi:YgiT-type zinc finger domain-containing protein
MNPSETHQCSYCGSRAVKRRTVEHGITYATRILNVKTEGWVCKSCGETSFDADVMKCFERMGNKLIAGDLDDFTSMGADYYYTRYEPRAHRAERKSTR